MIEDQARTIRIPDHMIATINKLMRTSRALVQEFGREPTSEEIAKQMDIPVPTVRKVLKIAQETISLETPIGRENDSHLGDFIEDRQVMSPAEAVINENLQEKTESVLKTLTPREEKVIKMGFGVGDGREHTLEEVGQSFAANVTDHPTVAGRGSKSEKPFLTTARRAICSEIGTASTAQTLATC